MYFFRRKQSKTNNNILYSTSLFSSKYIPIWYLDYRLGNIKRPFGVKGLLKKVRSLFYYYKTCSLSWKRTLNCIFKKLTFFFRAKLILDETIKRLRKNKKIKHRIFSFRVIPRYSITKENIQNLLKTITFLKHHKESSGSIVMYSSKTSFPNFNFYSFAGVSWFSSMHSPKQATFSWQGNNTFFSFLSH